MKLFQKKSKKEPEGLVKKTEETSLMDADFNRRKLFKRGVHLMAEEKLEDAVEVFQKALRIEPGHVETMLKLGYSKFHLDDHIGALEVYDQVLDIDVTDAEAWNLKSLVHYEQKNYAKALDSIEKSVESQPTYGMAWYNKACYLSLLNQVPDSLDALKRSIEIDVKNAKRAVKDRDFVNVRIEAGFKRIIEVVVLESVRQGYHTIGPMVWTTYADKEDINEALIKLIEKGLIVRNEKRDGLQKIPTYDLVPEMAHKLNAKKASMLRFTQKKLPRAITNLKEIVQAIQSVKMSIEEEKIEDTIDNFDQFIDTKKYGQQMIDLFFEEHREIRLWKIRLKDRGVNYLIDNKQKMKDTFDGIEVVLSKKLRSQVAQQ